jgi:hypothetical protein
VVLKPESPPIQKEYLRRDTNKFEPVSRNTVARLTEEVALRTEWRSKSEDERQGNMHVHNKIFVPRMRPEFVFSDLQYFSPNKWTYLYDHSPFMKSNRSRAEFQHRIGLRNLLAPHVNDD